MKYTFVDSIKNTLVNIETFNREIANRGSLPSEQDRDLQILIGRTELWALYRDVQGRWHAGPSKYIMIRDVSAAVYTKIRRVVHSGNAANHLRVWLPKHPVSQSHPGWREVEALAEAHAIGARVQREALGFVLFDALASSTSLEAKNEIEARDDERLTPDLERSALVLSKLEEQELNLMVALARAMRPEVRGIALRELAKV